MVARPFPAYEGNEPYFFVSYAHDDASLVYQEMSWIRGAGFNLWYDDGIHVGTLWRRVLADALLRSTSLLFMRTERSVLSDYCNREINFALDENKQVISVELAPAELPAELRFAISDRQVLRKFDLDEATYRDRLITVLQQSVENAREVRPQLGGKDASSMDRRVYTANSAARMSLGTIAVLETPSPDTVSTREVSQSIAGAGGQVLSVAGSSITVLFDSAQRAIHVLLGTSGISHAGASVGDLLFTANRVQGDVAQEARALCEIAKHGELQLNSRLARVVELDKSSFDAASSLSICVAGE